MKKQKVWDIEKLQNRFGARIKTIETELNGLKKYKVSESDFYKKAHDEQIGAQQVFILLESTAALMSRTKFVSELKRMRSQKPVDHSSWGYFDFQSVIDGWNRTLDDLIEEFSEDVS